MPSWRSSTASELRDLFALTKPGITRMVLVTAAAGFWLGASGNESLALMLHTFLGTALVASGTNALNQWWERDRDALMRRTRSRPLPAGRVAPGPALALGVGLGTVGVAELAVSVNGLTAVLAAVTLVSYVFVYTPLKPRSPSATLVGSVPGALPIAGGWTAAGGAIEPALVLLVALLFLWQVPHFLALDWLYRDDYARAGFRTLSVVDPTGCLSGRQAALYAGLLVPVTISGAWFGLTTPVAAVAAGVCGAALTVGAVAFARRPSRRAAGRVFGLSVGYLPVVLAVLALGKVR